MRTTGDIYLTEQPLLDRLSSMGIETNVLVTGCGPDVDRVARHLAEQLPAPLAVATFPGELRLPSMSTRTWLLHDVSRMSLEQQEQIADWASTTGGVRMVAISSKSLWTLVENGRFLERLYYRLNTIVCEALTGGGRSTYDEGAAACRS